MARNRSQTLTDGELRIMDVIWKLDEASVKDVTAELNKTEAVAYNTVQTMMGILRDKGFLSHRKEGRAFIYTPLINRQSARRTALVNMLSRFFDDSPSALVQNLLEDDTVDPMEIDRLRQMISQAADQDDE